MKILIVEDHPEDRRLLRYAVERHGHQAVEAADGEEGLEQAALHHPDLIISDALMPRLDGFQFLRRIKQDAALKEIPFIFYSAVYTGQREGELALSLGAEAFIVKPKEPEELWEDIHAVMEKAKLNKKKDGVGLLAEEEEYLKEYGQIVATKLEEKVRELDAELTERKQLEAERERLLQEFRQANCDLTALTEITADSFSTLNLEEMLQFFLKRLVDIMKSDAAVVFLKYGDALRARAVIGLDEDIMERYSLPVGEGVAGKIAASMQGLYVEDIQTSDLFKSPFLKTRGLRTVVGVPIIRNEELIGVVHTGWLALHPRHEREFRLLEITAERCANAIFNCQLHENMQDILKQLTIQIDQMPVGNIVWDVNFQVESWNPAAEKIFGYPADEALGRHPYDLIVPQGIQPRITKLWKGLLAGEAWASHSINENGTKDGRTIMCEWFNTLLRRADGRPVGVLSMVVDITERNEIEDRLRHTMENLRRAMEGTIMLLALTVETKDPYTAGHQRRVANLARAIATEMGLPSNQIDGIRHAGLVHDVGKVGVPSEILSKPGKISQIEFDLIKTHVQAGYDLLKNVDFPWPIDRMVYQHHERLDGSGYPQCLAGDEIILEARILTVADVVEAMASYRPYRPALGIDKALEEIRANQGIYYDPAVADACIRLFKVKGFTLE